jgi:hypothetical protein
MDYHISACGSDHGIYAHCIVEGTPVLAYCKPEDGASSLQYPTQDPQMGIGGPAGIASHHKEEKRAPWLPEIFGRAQARASAKPKQRHGRQQGIAAADQRPS